MTKGFTLIELAISMVIIGIITTMTVKGHQLINSAKIRKELLVVKKLELAVMSYLANDGKPEKFFGLITPTDLHSNQIIDRKELQTNLSKYGKNIEWTAMSCREREKNGKMMFELKAGGASYCATLLVSYNVNNAGSASYSTYNMPKRWQCGIEVVMDDKNIWEGNMRRQYGSATDAADFTPKDYANCAEMGYEESRTDQAGLYRLSY